MRVFISWSGERSLHVAKALREWIPDVLNAVKPWMSHDDIAAGERWGPTVSRELEQTQFGIVCLTPENVTEPWIHFEAGALAKQVQEAFVCPYLIDLDPDQIPIGPLSQFQAKRANRSDTFGVVTSLNKALGNESLDPDRLQRVFERLWPALEVRLVVLPKPAAEVPEHSPEDMIKEMLELVRALDRRLGQQRLIPRGKSSLLDRWRDVVLDEHLQWPAVGRVKTTNVEETCPLCTRPVAAGENWVAMPGARGHSVHTDCWLRLLEQAGLPRTIEAGAVDPQSGSLETQNLLPRRRRQ